MTIGEKTSPQASFCCAHQGSACSCGNQEQQSPLSLSYRSKRSVVQNSLLAFAAAFEILSKISPELKVELDDWREGQTFALGVLPEGPAITLRKTDEGMKYLGKGIVENPELKILFKNMDSAFLSFTGSMGSYMAFTQHRVILHGNLSEAMQVARAMDVVQSYLMPGVVLNKICKRPPQTSFGKMLRKTYLMTMLLPAILKNSIK